MSGEDPEIRDLRRGAAFRSLVIATMIAAYGWFMHQPTASFTQSFLIGIALQVILIILRRFVPPERLPRVMYAFETVADGITVLLFALGVLGGIWRLPQEV